MWTKVLSSRKTTTGCADDDDGSWSRSASAVVLLPTIGQQGQSTADTLKDDNLYKVCTEVIKYPIPSSNTFSTTVFRFP